MPSDPHVVGLTVLVLFLASIARSTFGFGDALLAMPPLTMLLGARAAVPLVAVAIVIPGIVIPWRDRQHVIWREAKALTLGSIPGLVLGVLVLRRADDTTVRWLVGCATITYALWALLLRRAEVRAGPRWVWLFGFLSGLFGGAATTGGPPAVMYASLRGWPPAIARATLQAFYLFLCFAVVIGHVASGLWKEHPPILVLWAAPAIVLGVLIGERLHRRLDPARFWSALHVILLALGLALLLT
jgi:uncharacterized membrane protein YfcA